MMKYATITHCAVIEGEIAYTEMDGLVHFSIDSRGDELKYQWKINGSESLIRSVSDNGSAITTDQLPLGTTQVSVMVTNDIGSDLRTIVVVNASNSGTYCVCMYIGYTQIVMTLVHICRNFRLCGLCCVNQEHSLLWSRIPNIFSAVVQFYYGFLFMIQYKIL